MKHQIVARLLVGVLMVFPATALAAFAPNFNFDGILVDSSNNPITTSTNVKFQIIAPNPGACVLYEETLTVTPDAEGAFTTKVGANTNTNASALTWTQIFQNGVSVTGAASCAYSPAANDDRKLRVFVNGTALSPDYSMSPAPMATVAETLDGTPASGFVKTTGAQVMAGPLTLASQGVLRLGDSATGFVGFRAPSTATPTTYTWPAADAGTPGYVLSSDAAGVLSWVAPSGGGGSGTVTSVSAGTGITVTGTATIAPTVGLTSGIATPGTSTKVTYDTYGRVTAGANLAEGDIPTLTSGWGGSVDATKISGTVGNNVSAASVSGTTVSGYTLRALKDGSTEVSISANGSMSADYSLVLPVDDGTASQFLQTDGNGNLSWQTVGAGSTSTLTSAGDIGLTAAPGSGAVVIYSGASSNSSTSGALIVDGTGGIGAGGNIWSGASMFATNFNASGTVYAQTMAGASTASQSLYLDSTTNATKGSVFLGSGGSKIRVGSATSPSVSLDLGDRTDGIRLPSGTTGERSSATYAGIIRYNIDTTEVEYYNGTSWATLASGGGAASSFVGGGNAAGPSFTLNGDANTGFFSDTAETISVAGNGGEVARFSGVASGVNYVRIMNSISGSGPNISAQGSDANINISLAPKGTGSVIINPGKLGIGTAAPTSKLDIYDTGTGANMRLTTLDSSQAIIELKTTTSLSKYWQMYANGDAYGSGPMNDFGISYFDGGWHNSMRFGTNAGLMVGNGANFAGGSLTPPADGMAIEGSVGIGSTNPVAKLDVRSPAAATKGMVIRGFSGQTASLQEWQDSTGTVLARIGGTGYLGLGTSPSWPLHVATPAGPSSVAKFQSAGTGGHVLISDNTSNGSYSPSFGVAGDSIVFRNWDGSTNWAERMRIAATTGFVGIATTAPGSALDVKGTLRLSGSSSGYVGFAPAPAASTTTYTLPTGDGTNGQFLKTNGSATLSWADATIGASSVGTAEISDGTITTADLATGAVALATKVSGTLPVANGGTGATTLSGAGILVNGGNSFGANSTFGNNDAFDLGFKTSGSVRLHITAAGNVGIGTTIPATPLDVVGAIQTDAYFQSTNSGYGLYHTSAGIHLATYLNDGYGQFGTHSPHKLALQVNGGDKMTILPNGNVGIGTTSPSVSFDVGQKTDALRVPAGSDGQRPGSPANGDMRYNTDQNGLEVYAAGWKNLTPPFIAHGIQQFTTVGSGNTFTVPAGVTQVKVTIAGGGGGGCNSGCATETGGKGGQGIAYVTSLTPGSGITVTVGGGGTVAATGTNGGSSSFGGIVDAPGGVGASSGVPGANGGTITNSQGTMANGLFPYTGYGTGSMRPAYRALSSSSGNPRPKARLIPLK